MLQKGKRKKGIGEIDFSLRKILEMNRGIFDAPRLARNLEFYLQTREC